MVESYQMKQCYTGFKEIYNIEHISRFMAAVFVQLVQDHICSAQGCVGSPSRSIARNLAELHGQLDVQSNILAREIAFARIAFPSTRHA